MCGICGIIDFDHPTRDRRAVLEAMLSAIVHRGPDDEGVLIDEGIALGMRRLSIIDLEGGSQPIYSEPGDVAVVLNGEIYNYVELRQQLLARGHHFATQSDTEVIVHLYEEMGPRCVDELRGMFAFAVWDRQRETVFVTRDRLGVKPLYFTRLGDKLLFASEIKALLAHPQVERQLDLDSVSAYLALKYVPAPRTMFVGIHSLPPGHTLSCDRQGVQIERYWDYSCTTDTPPASEDEYAQRLGELLRESVRLRLRSDVPFGAFLSGGLDSSTIVALMSEMLTEPVKTFSVGFQAGGEQDELPYAREVAQRFGCDHHEILVGPDDFTNLAERVLWHLDQPIADQATIATYMVAQLASAHVKMVLTGEGGDELFAGYARYVGEQYSPYMRWMPGAAGAALRRLLPRLPGVRRAKIAANALTYRGEAERFSNWFPLFNSDARQRLCYTDRDVAEAAFADQLARCDATDSLGRMLYVDTKLWLADYLLLRGDKLTMAHSLEGRVPLLDHKLVEFAARLPSNLKLCGHTRKYLLKRVAADLLPARIVHRKKQGFPIPIAQWLRGPARPMMRDCLTAAAVQSRGLFEWSEVERLVEQHESGFADHGDLLWGLISLEMWQRQFLDMAPHNLSNPKTSAVSV